MILLRSQLVFENAIKSDATRKIYVYFLSRFLRWAKLPDSDALLQLKETYLQELLEDYVIHLKKRISPNSFPPIFAALELFFMMNSKNLQFKRLRKMFPEKIKKSGGSAWDTKDIQKMLKVAKSKRNKALIHIMASTGCRVGSLPDLKLKHIQDMQYGCKAVLFYEGSNSEYYGFLIPEASAALQEYLDERQKQGEKLHPESPVISKVFQSGVSQKSPIDISSIKSIVLRIIRNSGIARTRLHQRYDIQMDHGFRKRFNTILKSNDLGNVSLMEKLMGHDGVFQLDGTYLKPTKERLFQEFKKHIPDLTIDDAERLRTRNNELEAERTELENEKIKVMNLKADVEKLKSDLGPILREIAKRSQPENI